VHVLDFRTITVAGTHAAVELEFAAQMAMAVAESVGKFEPNADAMLPGAICET
jgi:hypothetical protein